MATLGVSGSATYAVTLSGIGEMVTVLPDNTANLIQASDVRNVVFTLYEEIQGVSSSINSIASQTYSNSNQSTVTVGGITSGSTFSGITYQQLLDQMLYPYVSPTLTLSVSNTVLEFGNTTTLTLSWQMTKRSNPIVSSSVTGPTGSPSSIVSFPSSFGATTAGTVTLSPLLNEVSIFTFSVDDTVVSPPSGGSNYATVSVSWSNRVYWGVSSTTSSITNSSTILGLSGAGVGSGSALQTTRVKNYDGINGSGGFLTFAFPTSYGTPSFLVNGIINNAFTRVNTSFSLTNSFGYTSSYDVWKSNTNQFSPIENFQIN